MGAVGTSSYGQTLALFQVVEHAKKNGDIFLTKQLTNDFTPKEIKNMVDKINEVYDEFGINPSVHSDKLVYTLESNEKDLEEMLATGAAIPSGILEVNPKSPFLRKDDFVNIYHEMGHLIEFELLHRKMPAAKISETSNMANRLVKEAQQYLKKTEPNASEFISNYGLTNNRETVADAVRDYMINKDKAKPMSKAVVRQMKKYVKSTGLGNPK